MKSREETNEAIRFGDINKFNEKPGFPFVEEDLFIEGARFCRISSAGIDGIQMIPVEIEVSILPRNLETGRSFSFSIEGLGGREVQESKNRVFAALSANGFSMPEANIVVNLYPASIGKKTTAYDLPIAMSILEASKQIPSISDFGTMVVGELSLDGRVNPIKGVLPIAFMAKMRKFSRLLVPVSNYDEAMLVRYIDENRNLEIIPIGSLNDVINYFNRIPIKVENLPVSEINKQRIVDFEDIRGQEHIKKALEVAMAGGHSVLMFGAMGSGKTMMAEALPGIMPPLSDEELLEVLQIESIKGMFSPEVVATRRRPFRSPHYGVSLEGMTGSAEGPGELSLAHRGVLFLDEFTFFNRRVIAALRGPLSTGSIAISRKSGTFEYPSNVTLIAAMNPCPCGYHGDGTNRCQCTPKAINKYLEKISGPILDRIDMILHINPVPLNLLGDERKSESSEVIRQRIIAARVIQSERFSSTPEINCNANMLNSDIAKHCRLGNAQRNFYQQAANSLNLSARGYYRLLKVSRTIADLEGSEQISIAHLSQALDWRQRW